MTEDLDLKQFATEALGTGLLVFFAVGVATLSFGKGFNFAAYSPSAGVVATALAFGLVLLALAYALGPISGCNVNPAVTIGFLFSGRMKLQTAIGYWIAQFVGGILGALLLYGMFTQVPTYKKSMEGLGQNGYGSHSLIHLGLGGAFLAEVVMTFFFVFVVLAVTAKGTTSPYAAPVAIGLSLTVVHLIGIPLTGTSVNPARSFGPALVVGGDALKQVWLFILAPLVGGVIAAIVSRLVVLGGEEKVHDDLAANGEAIADAD
jgi:aquaporin Z